MLNVFYVAIGGAIGATLRYGIAQIMQSNTFPYATLTVNLLGALLIGLIMGWMGSQSEFPIKTQLFLVTGILGGFTTFSSFVYENWIHIEKGEIGPFLLYFIISNVGGIALAILGYKLTINQLNI